MRLNIREGEASAELLRWCVMAAQQEHRGPDTHVRQCCKVDKIKADAQYKSTGIILLWFARIVLASGSIHSSLYYSIGSRLYYSAMAKILPVLLPS